MTQPFGSQEPRSFPAAPADFDLFQELESSIFPSFWNSSTLEENYREIPSHATPREINTNLTEITSANSPVLNHSSPLPSNRTAVAIERMGVVSGRVTKPTRGTTRPAYGRGGRLACSPCRNSKKGWECIPQNPERPFDPPCRKCVSRNKSDECDGRKWPEKKRRASPTSALPRTINPNSVEFSNFMAQILSRLDNMETRVQEMQLRLMGLTVRDMSVVREPENNPKPDSSLSGGLIQVSGSNQALHMSSPSPKTIEYPSGSVTTIASHSEPFASHRLTRNRQILYPDFRTILETISACVDPARAQHIAEELHLMFERQGTRVTDLRTLTFRNFALEIPIIAWQEGSDADVLAFCKVFDTGQPCSWLMHLGFGASSRNLGNWNRASIRWFVGDLTILKELLARAQHILGLLQLSEDDLDRLCHENCKSSRESFRRIIGLRVAHELRMKELNASIEESTNLLEAISTSEVIVGMDGNRYTMYRASVDLKAQN